MMKFIPLSLRQIDYLIAVADTGSTAAAARTLNVSQPTVSIAISKAESILGRELFYRSSGQGMKLTSFGIGKLGELRDLRARFVHTLQNEDSADRKSVLNLGVFTTLGPRYLPSLVRAFEDLHPSMTIRPHEGDLEQLYTWLEERKIEAALIYEFGVPSDLDIYELCEAKPYGVVPEGHPLAGLGSVELGRLLDYPLILMNLPFTRSFFLSLAMLKDRRPEIAYETGSVEILRSMVANGFGVGLLATDIRSSVAYDGKRVVRLAIKDRLPSHRIAIATHRHVAASLELKTFRNFAGSFFKAGA